jgi:hypothetical protein
MPTLEHSPLFKQLDPGAQRWLAYVLERQMPERVEEIFNELSYHRNFQQIGEDNRLKVSALHEIKQAFLDYLGTLNHTAHTDDDPIEADDRPAANGATSFVYLAGPLAVKFLHRGLSSTIHGHGRRDLIAHPDCELVLQAYDSFSIPYRPPATGHQVDIHLLPNLNDHPQLFRFHAYTLPVSAQLVRLDQLKIGLLLHGIYPTDCHKDNFYIVRRRDGSIVPLAADWSGFSCIPTPPEPGIYPQPFMPPHQELVSFIRLMEAYFWKFPEMQELWARHAELDLSLLHNMIQLVLEKGWFDFSPWEGLHEELFGMGRYRASPLDNPPGMEADFFDGYDFDRCLSEGATQGSPSGGVYSGRE